MEMGWEQLLPILLNQLMGTKTTTHDDEKIQRMMRDILQEHSSRKYDKNYEVTQKILELFEKSMEAKNSQEKVEELTQKVNELMKEKASTSPAPQQEETNTNPSNDGDEVKKIYQMLEEIKADMRRGKQRQNRGGGAFAKFSKQNRGGDWRNPERVGNAEASKHDYYGEQRPFPQQSEASGGFSQLVGNPPIENPGFQNQFDQPRFNNNDQREHRPVFYNRGRGNVPPHFRRHPPSRGFTNDDTNDDQIKNSNKESNFAGENQRPYIYSSQRGRSNFQHRGQFRGRGHGFGRGHSQGRGQFHNKEDSSHGHIKKEFKKSDHKQAPKNVQSTAEVDICHLFMKFQQQMEEQKKGQSSQQTSTKTAFKVKSQQVKHTTETNVKPKNKDTSTTKTAGVHHSKEGNNTKKASSIANSSNSDKGAKKKQNRNTTPRENSSASNISFNIQLQLENN